MTRGRLALFTLAGSLATACGRASKPAPEVTPAANPLANARTRPPAAADEAEWPSAARDPQNTRYSALHDVDTTTVGKLDVAWTFKTGIERGHEAAPLVVGGMLYIVTPFPNRVHAFDLRDPNPRPKWTYEATPEPRAQGVACCDVVNRGAAYADGRLFFNTLDNHTIALDGGSGRELWNTKLGDVNRGETMTMAPLVVKDRVLVGNSGGELGVRGWLTALDVSTGAIAWRAYSTGPDADVLIGAEFRPFYPQDRGKDLGVTSWPPARWQQGGARCGASCLTIRCSISSTTARPTLDRGTASSASGPTSGRPASSRGAPPADRLFGTTSGPRTMFMTMTA